MVKIVLKPHREESLLRFHPWVFSGAIAQIVGSPMEGDIVVVLSSDGRQLAVGHYQLGSIAVRVLSFNGDPCRPDFWIDAISRAVSVRMSFGLLLGQETSCCRLVHGEGDGLPGLIIDWYDGVCVIQAHSVGMFRSKKQICDALVHVFGDRLKAVYDKSSGTAPFKAGLDLVDGYIWKRDGFNDDEFVVFENGNKFLVNWVEGQKTGFFLDQRDNRALVGKYSTGRKVLNLFCYTGGFSVYAAANGAALVDSVDSSARAVELLQKNMEINSFNTELHYYCEDAIDFLNKTEVGKYDLIIVDPPAFAKHRAALKNALRAYQRLNAAAISRVAPGGLVFTFSCSQVVDKTTFSELVFSAAAQTGRSVRIMNRLFQGPDHPVSIYHPEGEYLKGLLLYVE